MYKDCSNCNYKYYSADSKECKNCVDSSNWEERSSWLKKSK